MKAAERHKISFLIEILKKRLGIQVACGIILFEARFINNTFIQRNTFWYELYDFFSDASLIHFVLLFPILKEM